MRIYATQGGGKVKESGNHYVFIEAPPNQTELRVGDPMPEEWGTVCIDYGYEQELSWDEYDTWGY